jgi:hypothetical protein
LLLTVGWIVVSRKELSILCNWLDPGAYEPPDETMVAMGIAGALAILFFASRSTLWFGIAYSVYAAINLAAVVHFKNQMVDVIGRSRTQLDKNPPLGVSLYRSAIDLLEVHYVKRHNITRVAATLFLGLTGLALSILSRDGVHSRLNTYAYIPYLSALVLLEGVVMFSWRAHLYRAVRPLVAARYEVESADLRNDEEIG